MTIKPTSPLARWGLGRLDGEPAVEWVRRLRETRVRPGEPDFVVVYDKRVLLPDLAEVMNRAGSLDEVITTNAEEHEGGCHGGRCRGRCAEEAYARWSPLFEVSP